MAAPVSQLVTASQIDSPEFLMWCERLKHPRLYHRKLWEWIYLCQVLETQGLLALGSRGLGFGVGKERMVSYFAHRGCRIVATDMFPEAAARAGWTTSDQYSSSIAELNSFGLCDPAIFSTQVSYQHVDMNHLDSGLKDFDFVWSSCAFEHLGDLQKGMDFVFNSLNCLKPGGVAVHTTEFNLSDFESTVTNGATVIYREKDVFALGEELLKLGCDVEFNLNRGGTIKDWHIATDPARHGVHLKIVDDGFVMTSLGITIRKAP